MRRQERLSRYPNDYFSLIIIDEAHHSLAESYLTVLRRFSSARVLGVTATPYRSDGESLGRVFQSLAYEYDLARGIREGYLSRISVQVVPVRIDLRRVRTSHGDYVPGQVETALLPHIDETAVQIAKLCRKRKTLIFLPLVKTAQNMCTRLRELGLDAREVDGKSTNRAEVLSWFSHASPGSVLCNSMLLTEGWDCPSVDCIVVLRVTQSHSLYMQMVGRGTRLSPETDKKDLLLLDFLWLEEWNRRFRPADIFTTDEDVASMMTRRLEASRGPVDLEEALKQSERPVQGSSESRLEEALAARADHFVMDKERIIQEQRQLAAEVRCKQGLRASMVQPGYAVQTPALAHEASSDADAYVRLIPASTAITWFCPHADSWTSLPHSDALSTSLQRTELESMGIDGSHLSARAANALLMTLRARKAEGKSTPRQVRLLVSLGFCDAPQWSKTHALEVLMALQRVDTKNVLQS